jgi:hypothetical protein
MSHRPGWRSVGAALLLLAAVLTSLGAPSDAATPELAHALRGTNYFGDGVNAPLAVAGDGTNLWVTNSDAMTVTKLSETSGAVEGITPLPEASSDPGGIAVDSSHVWVADFYGTTLTELSKSTGAALSVISIPGETCPCDGTQVETTVSADGTYVWVTEMNTGVLVQVDAATDSVVRTINFGEGDLQAAVDAEGTNVWVADYSGIDEYSASTGALVRSITGPSDDLKNATGVVTDDSHVWVTTATAVVELSASTGAFIRSLPTPELVGGESALSSDGTDLWVTLSDGVIEISEATGSVVRTVSRSGSTITEATGVVSNGSRVWVMDGNAGSFTELLASTGKLLHPVPESYQLSNPSAVAAGGAHVWVLGSSAQSQADGSLTELSSSTGRQESFSGGPSDPLGLPYQVLDDGPDVWVLAGQPTGGLLLTEFSTATAKQVKQVEAGAGFGQTSPEIALSDGRLWLLSGDPNTSISEYSALSGRYLGSVPDTRVGLPNGIVGITSSRGMLIVAGPTRLAVVSGMTGKLLHFWPRAPYCSPYFCELGLIASTSAVWEAGGALGVAATQYSLNTGAAIRTLNEAAIGFSSTATVLGSSGAMWAIGKFANVGANQGWVVEERSAASGSLEHSFTGGSFGFQGPGLPVLLGSHVWDTNYGGDGVSEWDNP